LLVNNHRVKHPSKAVQIIKNSIDKLNVVVGRGKRIDGMTYCLVRIDDNNNDIDKGDSRGNKESSSVGGESCSIASSSIKSKSKWQESKDSPSTIQSSTCHGLTFYQQNNLIYISNISPTSPFHKSNLQKGDILLSINGSNVQSIQDVVTLLNSNSSLDLDALDKGGGGGDGDSNPYIKNNKKEDRVVILLIYSIWKLRHRVLNEELQLVQEDDKKVKSSDSCKSSNSRSSKNSKVSNSKSTKDSGDDGSKQIWQATFSYQEEDQSTPSQQSLISVSNRDNTLKEEYIILRIPQTTVTFKLIFDNEEGKCTCPNPYASLLSFNNNDKLSKEEGKLSKEEAHMALDSLYQKYILPVIDALNSETGCILRLLRDLISGDSTRSSALTTTNSNANEPEPTTAQSSQEDLVNAAAKQTYEQQVTLRKSFMNIQHTLPLTTSSACSTLDSNMSRRSDVSNSNKGRQQVMVDSRKWSIEPLPPYQDLSNCKPATASGSEDKSTYSKDSKIDHLNKVDNDFQSQLNKLHISKKPRPKSSSRQGGEKTSIDSSNQFYGRDDDLELNPNRKKTPPKQRTPPRPPKKKLSPPRPNRKNELAMSDAAIQPRIQRRPSFVPVSDGKRLRSSIRLSGLSVLSSGEEEDSSSTSTTRSDEQSNSSSNDHHVNDRQYHPQDRPVQATPKSKHQQHRPSELTSSTDMVVYSPELAETSREKQAAVDAAKSLPKPQLKRRLKMRNGDIRKNYKVSHRIIGTGAFGVVRSCMERSTREKYAVKSILKKGNVKNATLLKNEIALVQCVHHRNVVRVIDVIQDQEYIHIIMEELKGGDLFDRVIPSWMRLGQVKYYIVC